MSNKKKPGFEIGFLNGVLSEFRRSWQNLISFVTTVWCSSPAVMKIDSLSIYSRCFLNVYVNENEQICIKLGMYFVLGECNNRTYNEQHGSKSRQY